MIAVIIVTYNAVPWHEKCFAPLYNNQNNGRVYIIDNGSTDGTQELIRTKYPKFIFYQSTINLGFGKANNIGIKKALEDGCTHFLLLNQDASITWENIFVLVEHINNNPQFGILSPVHFFRNNVLDKKFSQAISNPFNAKYLPNYLINVPSSQILQVIAVPAAIWMISKKCLEKVGFFNPIFYHYGEDTNYTQRCHYHGIGIGIVPSVYGYHFRKQDTFLIENAPFKTLLQRTYISLLIKILDINKSFLNAYFHTNLLILRRFGKSVVSLNFKLAIVVIIMVFKINLNLNKYQKNRKFYSRTSNYFESLVSTKKN